MIHIDAEKPQDELVRDALLDRAFGPGRHAKTCQRLRDGREPAEGLSFGAYHAGVLVGTLRFWSLQAGGRDALMLGPLAVEETHRTFGIGATLIRVGLARAAELGHKGVLLVGDEPYYTRFGFSKSPVQGLVMPGPVDRARFLGLEFEPGALAEAQGAVIATGKFTVESTLGGCDRRLAA
ncbi:MAG: GNAT family N-acetyltransferase [Rhizobiales bacterium PAR1]|nr:MAG: GNAT family N-acetyltransferase [Rhizobiales bacterium PAR1]